MTAATITVKLNPAQWALLNECIEDAGNYSANIAAGAMDTMNDKTLDLEIRKAAMKIRRAAFARMDTITDLKEVLS